MGETLTKASDCERPVATESVDLPAMSNSTLAKSFAYCREVTRTQARNFYFGLKLLPEPKRSALCAIYTYMRTCDDLADTYDPAAGSQVESQLALIESFRALTIENLDNPDMPEAAGDHDLWPAFWYTAHRFTLDRDHLNAMLDGQRMDILDQQYRTFDDLYRYCYNVASVVGLVCVNIWGLAEPVCDDEQSRIMKMAEHRGIALQLTNILRDLLEDAQRGRVYLPDDELIDAGYDPGTFADDLVGGQVDDRFDRLMAFQIDRARDYYDQSAALEQSLDRQCRATSWAMCRIYHNLLDKIAGHPRRVLTRRVRLTTLQKMTIAMTAAWRVRRATASTDSHR